MGKNPVRRRSPKRKINKSGESKDAVYFEVDKRKHLITEDEVFFCLPSHISVGPVLFIEKYSSLNG